VAGTQREGKFDAMFDFPFYFALVDVFCRDQSPARLGAILSLDRLYDDPDSLVTLIDNHDLPRIATDCRGDLERVKQALTVQLTARGTPSLNYGTEAALTGGAEPHNRPDMRFEKTPLREHIAKVLELRRQHASLRTGVPLLVESTDDALAYARLTSDEAALIAINRGEESFDVSLPRELRSSEWRDGLSGERVEAGSIRVPAGEVRLLLGKSPRPGAWAVVSSQYREQWMRPTKTREVQVELKGAAKGESIYLVGSAPELGGWDAESGVGPLSGGSPVKASLPVGSVVEFKLVSRAKGAAPKWESGDNQRLFVRDGAGPMRLTVSWGEKGS
jgi:hypothetical protein